MILIKNATIYTMNGQIINSGMIAFDKKITFVGTVCEWEQSGLTVDKVIDANNAVVMPGLIDAHCHVGMFEDSIGFEGDDGNEDSDPITPHLRAIDAVNPFDRAFDDARLAGVTTVVTGPGSANPIGGQFAALKTSGICVDDMIIKAPVAMKFALGENPKSVYHGKNQAPLTRMGTMALIRETMLKAREYSDLLFEYESDTDEQDKPDYDIKYEALLPILRREIPVKIHAHRADDICSAIRLGKEFNIHITIEHCTDGEAVADILERENVPIMLGPTLSDRSKPELKNLSFSTYKALSDRKLAVSIITDHPEITIDHLPLCVAMAVKHGMDRQKALAAVTSVAADNCMIGDRVGRLVVGMDADIAVFTKEPVEFDAEVLYTFINGEIVFEKSHFSKN